LSHPRNRKRFAAFLLALVAIPVLSMAAARQAVTIYEAEPFKCVRCGKAFGVKAMIDSLTGRLASHSMFAAGDALKRLQMCADCRVVDMIENKNETNIFQVKR